MKRSIGRTGRNLNPIGLGCMGLSGVYNAPLDPASAVRLLQDAIDLGVEHFDTAEVYGLTKNEELLGAAFHDRRKQVFIATKWGPTFDIATGKRGPIDGTPANCRRAVEGSLKRLRTEVIDLYYLHRVDPKTPIEDSVGAMAQLVKEGKIRLIGLSEPSAETIKKAALIAPIAAVQSEYSIFTRDVEDGRLAAMEAVGASLVAYSPVGRGILTGAMKRDARPAGHDDFRNTTVPRFNEENYAANLDLVREIESIAAELSARAAQVALAWVLTRSPIIHAIPGTTRLENLKTNLNAEHIVLSAGQIKRLNALGARVAGARYTPIGLSAVNR